MKIIATGNYAVAEAVKQASPGVIAAYPITPQTEIVERIAQFVAHGEMACDYIPVESEHSAMAACIGASATGARAFTATSSQGLLYMHELLHWAAGARLPIVMAPGAVLLGLMLACLAAGLAAATTATSRYPAWAMEE